MVSFEFGKEIEKDVFRLITNVGQRKNSAHARDKAKNVFL